MSADAAAAARSRWHAAYTRVVGKIRTQRMTHARKTAAEVGRRLELCRSTQFLDVGNLGLSVFPLEICEVRYAIDDQVPSYV